MLLTDTSVLIIKFGTICGDCNITFKDHNHHKNFLGETILNRFTRRRVFLNKSFGPIKRKRCRAVPIEEAYKNFWLAIISCMFHLSKMTRFDRDIAVFASVLYFKLVSLLNNIGRIKTACVFWYVLD